MNGALTLLHALEESGLRLGGGAVDLVADHDVGEDAAGPELELPVLLVVDRDAGDVRRQQVGSELDAAHRAVDAACQRLGEHGLADPGDVLDQEVTFGEEHGDRRGDHVGLALDDALDVAADPLHHSAERVEVGPL
jgi:hypothetical protein